MPEYIRTSKIEIYNRGYSKKSPNNVIHIETKYKLYETNNDKFYLKMRSIVFRGEFNK